MTDVNPIPTTTPTQVIAALDGSLLAKIAELNKSLPAAFQGIAPIFAAPVIRMIQDNGTADITALYAKLTGLSTPAALDTLHANMTSDELVAEKLQLTPMLQKMAQDSYDAKQIGEQILGAVVSAGLSLALKALTF